MFIAAQSVWAAEDIYLFVAAFGAMRHHLPFHLCADFFGSCLRGFSRVGPEENCGDVYLGKILMCEGNVSQAIAQFEEALGIHPDFPEAEQNLRIAKGSSAQSP